MMREGELIARFTCLERRVLVAWIEEGVVAPDRDSDGYLFDHVDQSRVALACDLHYGMGLDHASLPVILSLVDQLHDVRRQLRAVAEAVSRQPDEVQQEISRHLSGGKTPSHDQGGRE